MSNRGMKKWAPFSSLSEQASELNKIKKAKNHKEMPEMSEDISNKINIILSNYHGEMLLIKFYLNGEFYSIESTLQKIDPVCKTVIFNKFGMSIPFSNILDIDQL